MKLAWVAASVLAFTSLARAEPEATRRPAPERRARSGGHASPRDSEPGSPSSSSGSHATPSGSHSSSSGSHPASGSRAASGGSRSSNGSHVSTTAREAPRVYLRPAPPLPMLPSLARVRVEAGRDRVVVIEDVRLPRGDWQSGGLDAYVAFGAPGTPWAFDAHLLPATPDGSDPPGDAQGDAVSSSAAPRRNISEQELIGPPHMAGMVVRIKESQLQRAFASGDVATLRLRSLLSPPAAGADHSRDVVARLGTAGGDPLTLQRIEVTSTDPRSSVVRAEAALCGPDAVDWPLSVHVEAKGPTLMPRYLAGGPIAPELAVRHPSDDLCIRWWTSR